MAPPRRACAGSRPRRRPPDPRPRASPARPARRRRSCRSPSPRRPRGRAARPSSRSTMTTRTGSPPRDAGAIRLDSRRARGDWGLGSRRPPILQRHVHEQRPRSAVGERTAWRWSTTAGGLAGSWTCCARARTGFCRPRGARRGRVPRALREVRRVRRRRALEQDAGQSLLSDRRAPRSIRLAAPPPGHSCPGPSSGGSCRRVCRPDPLSRRGLRCRRPSRRPRGRRSIGLRSSGRRRTPRSCGLPGGRPQFPGHTATSDSRPRSGCATSSCRSTRAATSARSRSTGST